METPHEVLIETMRDAIITGPFIRQIASIDITVRRSRRYE